tara:strand:+ start:34 stop:234 length:201 start_codon:yes stop_codon:yes gene_type:complete
VLVELVQFLHPLLHNRVLEEVDLVQFLVQLHLQEEAVEEIDPLVLVLKTVLMVVLAEEKVVKALVQ